MRDIVCVVLAGMSTGMFCFGWYRSNRYSEWHYGIEMMLVALWLLGIAALLKK